MSNDSRGGVAGEAPRVGADTIELRMRERIRDTIEEIVEEELVAALGAGPSSRVSERRGYRRGTRERTLTTTLGMATFEMPRARLVAGDGSRREWRSETIRRYERRTALWTKPSWACTCVARTRVGFAARWPHCCGAGRCRRTRCLGWSDVSRRTLPPGPSATWPASRSDT